MQLQDPALCCKTSLFSLSASSSIFRSLFFFLCSVLLHYSWSLFDLLVFLGYLYSYPLLPTLHPHTRWPATLSDGRSPPPPPHYVRINSMSTVRHIWIDPLLHALNNACYQIMISTADAGWFDCWLNRSSYMTGHMPQTRSLWPAPLTTGARRSNWTDTAITDSRRTYRFLRPTTNCITRYKIIQLCPYSPDVICCPAMLSHLTRL